MTRWKSKKNSRLFWWWLKFQVCQGLWLRIELKLLWQWLVYGWRIIFAEPWKGGCLKFKLLTAIAYWFFGKAEEGVLRLAFRITSFRIKARRDDLEFVVGSATKGEWFVLVRLGIVNLKGVFVKPKFVFIGLPRLRVEYQGLNIKTATWNTTSLTENLIGETEYLRTRLVVGLIIYNSKRRLTKIHWWRKKDSKWLIANLKFEISNRSQFVVDFQCIFFNACLVWKWKSFLVEFKAWKSQEILCLVCLETKRWNHKLDHVKLAIVVASSLELIRVQCSSLTNHNWIQLEK